MGEAWNRRRGPSNPIWRVPGLNILRSRSWASLALQHVESAGGEGVWRNDRHRISLLTDEAANLAVQFESGRTHEISGSGPRLFFCPAGTMMRVRSDAMRWFQLVQEPDLGIAPSSERGGEGASLAPLADFRDPLIAQIMLTLAYDVEDGPTDRLLAETLGAAISLRIRQRFDKRTAEPREETRLALSRERMRRVREFIDANLGEELSLRDLADVACLSPYHFSRSFKRAVGVGVHSYVVGKRLERAKELLTRTELSLAETAKAVGFDSHASFTRRFHHHVGVTPGRFRKETGQ
jgi:AraC family transcriptional regulator